MQSKQGIHSKAVPGETGIKFECEWIKAEAPPDSDIAELNQYRQKLYDLGLVGAYENGLGFGNLSIRTTSGFLITGSGTGTKERLTPQDYTEVTGYDLDKNLVRCKGPVKASSESMTHAAIYESDPDIKAVIHIHSRGLWKKLIDKLPTTNRDAEYGTPEMAREIMRVLKESDAKKQKVIVMGGHEEGIVSFDADLAHAFKAIKSQL